MFHGYVVERTYFGGATAAVRKVGLEGPTKHVAVVSAFWNEPQERLQMEGALRTGGTARSARPGLPAAPFAEAHLRGVVEPDSTIAAATPELGKPEAGGSTAERISGSSGSRCAGHWQVVEADAAEPSCASAFASRAATEARRVDHRSAEQPGVDRGFQRLVLHWEWRADGTADRARFVQSLPPDGSSAPGSGLEAVPPSFLAIVPSERLPRGDSRGQWRALRIQGASRAYAIERLVDRAGDSGRIHSAGASGAEWGPRTDAPGAQERDDPATLAPPAGAATAHGLLGEDL
jgi:hypothetical protein